MRPITSLVWHNQSGFQQVPLAVDGFRPERPGNEEIVPGQFALVDHPQPVFAAPQILGVGVIGEVSFISESPNNEKKVLAIKPATWSLTL